jgi:hypothetical protein
MFVTESNRRSNERISIRVTYSVDFVVSAEKLARERHISVGERLADARGGHGLSTDQHLLDPLGHEPGFGPETLEEREIAALATPEREVRAEDDLPHA